MQHERQFYIDGAWVDPAAPVLFDVIDPSTEEAFTQIALGNAADVDRAVAAARAAFPSFARSTRAERLELLRNILAEYERRYDELAATLSREMGATLAFARSDQAFTGSAHLKRMIAVLETFAFEWMQGGTLIAKEPIGVAGLITPWNWPINQIVCKVAPAIAAGCTMVLKPSEIAPLNAIIWSEIVHAAGVPKGVYNMVQGDGPAVGEAMSAHPGIDFMSFTGSTRAGIQVARAAAATVKRVSQELGGKSANILLPDVDFIEAVTKGVGWVMRNSGQSCNAPTRMFVPADRQDEVKAIAKAADLAHARRVAAEMRAGCVHVNYPAWDTAAPFGGYKQSGNGREYGKWALEEFLETKAVIGYDAA